MPPISRYEDGLTRILHSFNYDREFVATIGSFGSFQSWQNFVKVLNRLVIFTLLDKMVTADELFSDAGTWRNKNPAFVASNACIPS